MAATMPSRMRDWVRRRDAGVVPRGVYLWLTTGYLLALCTGVFGGLESEGEERRTCEERCRTSSPSGIHWNTR
jgi:hypothetical protein